MFAFIKPVITSTDGLCVAKTRCIPDALAFCASLAINASIFFPIVIIRSASSSITITINGSSSNTSGFSGSSENGFVNGEPFSWESFIF